MAKRRARTPGAPKSVEATRHRGSKRVNIPTAELEKFAEDEGFAPATVSYPRPSELLFPRDPAGDPQLVWRGKDEQDASDLTVAVLPIYIQEKISPQTLIEDLRSASNREQMELQLFADFNGLEFEQLVDFYKHQQSWTNRMILGDSLQVMTSLTEKEGLRGQVQCIYMDPPYGVKFGSNWQVSTRHREVRDGKAEDATRQPELVRAFRDTWKEGVHSYLSYLRDRLLVAREMLSATGSIFVQIGDENAHRVRALLDEVFGADNAVLTIVVKKKGATTPTDPVNDFVLWYAMDREKVRAHQSFVERAEPEDDPKFNTLIGPDGDHIRPGDGSKESVAERIAQGYRWARVNYPLVSQHPSAIRSVDFEWRGKRFSCGSNNQWRFDPETGLRRLALAGRLFDGGGKSLGGVVYWKDWPFVTRSNLWDDLHGEQETIFVVQTNRKIVERCLLMTTDPGDLVLDPTCGSGTTAYVAEQWGRRWITIDTSRVALALARSRLMSARYPYYLMADSPDGQRKAAERSGTEFAENKTEGDIRKGFVYKWVPRITLKSVASNPDIEEGMSREEIDAAIRRNTDNEVLYDQPYADPKVVRVSGPFTVESLSPHRVLDVDGAEPATERAAEGTQDFVQVVLDNLKTAGVQNTVKNERLVFETLESYPGNYVQASGTYSEGEVIRRAGISVGPEYGTVGADYVREAAKEAADDFDLIVVCGMAFDARVGETGTKLGRLTVLRARMNPDLSMGGELLKKTAAANLFTVFGEPDVGIRGADDGKIVVEVRGVDVYDPTTGEIRSHSTDDIACWFIDTDYNEESFFVRHAYFLGGDDPYEKLRRTLKADIDEAAWASLHSAVSRPFPTPSTGKIAIKVINHYGDEVLKVYEIPKSD